jgi:hypothetical protein
MLSIKVRIPKNFTVALSCLLIFKSATMKLLFILFRLALRIRSMRKFHCLLKQLKHNAGIEISLDILTGELIALAMYQTPSKIHG